MLSDIRRDRLLFHHLLELRHGDNLVLIDIYGVEQLLDPLDVGLVLLHPIPQNDVKELRVVLNHILVCLPDILRHPLLEVEDEPRLQRLSIGKNLLLQVANPFFRFMQSLISFFQAMLQTLGHLLLDLLRFKSVELTELPS